MQRYKELAKVFSQIANEKEMEKFLNWLIRCLEKENIDAILLAGDIFDNGTPSNRALEMYYRFLHRVAGSACRHVVIIAGNHDSPSLLNAPREILRYLNVHVIGCACDSPEEEVLVLCDGNGKPELIVCAVPYLRDRDIRKAEAGESIEDKAEKLVEGIRGHYRKIGEAAKAKQDELEEYVPIAAMGHLFTVGSQTMDGDGVRELYVGGLGRVAKEIFPACIDYLALGHLHMPQRVADSHTFRYSGSPIPMSFGEAQQQKIVLSVTFNGLHTAVTEIVVPCFQALEIVRGDWDTIVACIDSLKNDGSSAWLEVVYEDTKIIGDLTGQLQKLIKDTDLEILRIKNTGHAEQMIRRMAISETLDDLTEEDVFARCLNAHKVPKDQRAELTEAYQEVITALHEDDARAE